MRKDKTADKADEVDKPKKNGNAKPGGRPTLYTPELCEKLKKFESDKRPDKQQLADYLNIGIATLYLWTHKYPEFDKAIKSLDPATIGRPPEYDEGFCEVIRTLGSRGYSMEEMAQALDIGIGTFKRWLGIFIEFRSACEDAVGNEQAYFEELSRKHLIYDTPQGQRMDAALFARMMSARFPKKYRENATAPVQDININVDNKPNRFLFVKPEKKEDGY